MENRKKLVFPTVTICNGSPVRKSMIAENDELRNTLKGSSKDTGEVLFDPSRRVFESDKYMYSVRCTDYCIRSCLKTITLVGDDNVHGCLAYSQILGQL